MNVFVKLGHDIARLWNVYAGMYLSGVWNTISLAVLCTAVGCLIGLLCGVLNTIPFTKNDSIFKRILLRAIRVVNQIYVEVFRGTPMILQAVVIYYGLPYFTNNALRFSNVWLCAFVVVSINTGAYMAESVRGGIISIDPGQTEGAKAIGMTHWQTMTNVILPQALRNILPQIGNNLIITSKDYASATEGVFTIDAVVTNSKGDTAEISLPLIVENRSLSAPQIKLSKYLLRIEKGTVTDPSQFIVSAVDYNEKDITKDITIDTNLDVNSEGTYLVHYYAVDDRGERGHSVLIVIVGNEK